MQDLTPSGRRGNRADHVVREGIQRPPELGMLVWIQAREVTTQALPSGRNELRVHAHAGLREHQRLPVNSESETTRLQVGKQWGDLVQGHAQFRDQTFRRDRHTLPQSGEEPELRRRKVDADSSRKVLVALPAVLS